jgi:glycosyltransferase involved in cell wall biosynthesis
MSTLYRQHHFTVIPFTTPDGGKECPNSLLEGLACGVPVLISSVAPFAGFVARHDCGEVFDPTPEGFKAALDRGMSRWQLLSANARSTASANLSQDRALARYGEIYAECLDGDTTTAMEAAV